LISFRNAKKNIEKGVRVMKLIELKCKSCGAILQVNEELKNVSCNYCGQNFIMDNEKKEYIINKNINIHKRYTNDADVIRAKNETRKDNKEFRETMIGIIGGIGIPLFIIISIVIGLSINKWVAQSEGKISAGYYRDLLGKDYETVEAHFEAAGFTNIELIDLNDFWNKGKVETISVGGDTSFESMDYFSPETKVVISHH